MLAVREEKATIPARYMLDLQTERTKIIQEFLYFKNFSVILRVMRLMSVKASS